MLGTQVKIVRDGSTWLGAECKATSRWGMFANIFAVHDNVLAQYSTTVWLRLESLYNSQL